MARRKVGVFRLSEPKEFTKHYETAAWYERILVEPGDYDAILVTDGYPWVIVSLEGVVTKSFFPTLWGGVMVGNRGIDERIGLRDTYVMQFNPYMIAKLALDNHPDWILDSDVEAKYRTFESVTEPGRTITTTDLVVDGKQY